MERPLGGDAWWQPAKKRRRNGLWEIHKPTHSLRTKRGHF